MKKNVQTAVCRVLGIAMLAVTTGAAAAQAQDSPDAELNKVAEAFMQAWTKADAKAIAALHSKDAVRLAGTGQPAVVGTAAIEQAFIESLTGPYKGTTLTIKQNQYRRVAADTYVGEGTYEVTGGTPPPGAPVRGQYMNTMVRQDGRWVIAASAVMPAPQQK